MGSSSLTRNRTLAPWIGSTESQPLDHQGSSTQLTLHCILISDKESEVPFFLLNKIESIQIREGEYSSTFLEQDQKTYGKKASGSQALPPLPKLNHRTGVEAGVPWEEGGGGVDSHVGDLQAQDWTLKCGYLMHIHFDNTANYEIASQHPLFFSINVSVIATCW